VLVLELRCTRPHIPLLEGGSVVLWKSAGMQKPFFVFSHPHTPCLSGDSQRQQG
jgi:hypothetical protein